MNSFQTMSRNVCLMGVRVPSGWGSGRDHLLKAGACHVPGGQGDPGAEDFLEGRALQEYLKDGARRE